MLTTSDFAKGEQIRFGRPNGEKTLGEVIKVNPTKLKVKALETRGEHQIGSLWDVPPSLCTKVGAAGSTQAVATAPKRPESVIMAEIGRCYAMLSPENLHCDGEISRTEANRRGAALRRQLKALFKELGREVGEGEAFGGPRTPVKSSPLAPFQTTKLYDFAKDDRVAFAVGSRIVEGFVRSVNAKTVSVEPIGRTDGRYYRVSPSLLTKV